MRYQYCKIQFEDAVKFVSENNRFFKGQTDSIRSSLSKTIRKFSEDSSLYLGTMGFHLMKTLEEDEKNDQYWYVEIFVDPALGNESRYDTEAEDYFDSKYLGALN